MNNHQPCILATDSPLATADLVDDIEQHRFRPIKLIYWRNPEYGMRPKQSAKKVLILKS